MKPVNPPKAASVADDVSIHRTQVPKPPLKFAQKSQTLPDLLREYSLPRVIRCEDSAYHKQQLRSNFDLEQPLLAVQVRRVVKVAARNLSFDSHSNLYSCVGNDLLIPEDYPGWFAVLGAPDSLQLGHDKAIPYFSNLLRLEQSGCNQFLVGGQGYIRGLVTETVAGKVTNIDYTILPGTVLRSAGLYTTGEQPTQKKEKNNKKNNKTTESRPKMFLKCLDEHERTLWIPSDQKGKFYAISRGGPYGGSSPFPPIMKMAAILKKFKLPLVVRLVHGKTPSTPCTFTSSLLLTSSGVSETLIASTLVCLKNINIELPLGSDIKFYAAENMEELVHSQAYIAAYRFCLEKLPSYIREMKVVYGSPQLVELRRTRNQTEENTSTPFNPSTPKASEIPAVPPRGHRPPDKAPGKLPARPQRDPPTVQGNNSTPEQVHKAEGSDNKTVDSTEKAQKILEISKNKETGLNSNSTTDENKGQKPTEKDQITGEELQFPERDNAVVQRRSRDTLVDPSRGFENIFRHSLIIHSGDSSPEESRPSSILIRSKPGTPNTPSKNLTHANTERAYLTLQQDPGSPPPCKGPTGSPKPFQSRMQNSDERMVPSDVPPPVPNRCPIPSNTDKNINTHFSLLGDEDSRNEDDVYANMDLTVLQPVVFPSSKHVQEKGSPLREPCFPLDRPNLETRMNNPADHYDKADEDNKSTTYHNYSSITDSRPSPSFDLRQEPDFRSPKESYFKYGNNNEVSATSNIAPRVMPTCKPDIHSVQSKHSLGNEQTLQSPSVPHTYSQEQRQQDLVIQPPLLPKQKPIHQTQVTRKLPSSPVPRTTNKDELTQNLQPSTSLQTVPQGHVAQKPPSSPTPTSNGRDRTAVKPPQALNLQITTQRQAAPTPPPSPSQQKIPPLTQRQLAFKLTPSPVLESSNRGNMTQSPSISSHPKTSGQETPPLTPRSPQTLNQEKLARKPPFSPVQTLTTGTNSKFQLSSPPAPPLPPHFAAPSSPKPPAPHKR